MSHLAEDGKDGQSTLGHVCPQRLSGIIMYSFRMHHLSYISVQSNLLQKRVHPNHTFI